ncbi:MAG: hypothetical protein GXY54_00655 [Deltaproteobacteria bacterium]|nr:hypothetical protein [Deltaproteobacteria bacterium]
MEQKKAPVQGRLCLKNTHTIVRFGKFWDYFIQDYPIVCQGFYDSYGFRGKVSCAGRGIPILFLTRLKTIEKKQEFSFVQATPGKTGLRSRLAKQNKSALKLNYPGAQTPEKKLHSAGVRDRETLP